MEAKAPVDLMSASVYTPLAIVRATDRDPKEWGWPISLQPLLLTRRLERGEGF